MTGETKGSFWTSTAAIITAIGTLIGGLAAAAALLLPRLLDDDDGGNQTTNPAVTDSAGNTVKFDGVLYWPAQTILLLNDADFDASTGPDREPEILTADIYLWSEGKISGPNNMVKWTGGGAPNQAQCAARVLSHGVSGRQTLDSGEIFCLRTNQQRVAMVKILGQEQGGWEIEVTVWKQRLDPQ